MRVRGWLVVAFMVAASIKSGVAAAEILPVPDSVRSMSAPHDDVHLLRTVDDTVLGEQRSHAVRNGDKLTVDVTTRFAAGDVWDERAVMDLAADGYRPRSFHRTGRAPGGALVNEQAIDFATGEIRWLADGKRGSAKLPLEPDTYIGPMFGVVLAPVPGSPGGSASFHTVVFRPDPTVYTMRAAVVAQETYRVDKLDEPTTKMQLRADLGPVQNTLFASLIPTHYFWFTRDTPPEFFAFEGTLGFGGPELRMVPQRPDSRTAMAQ